MRSEVGFSHCGALQDEIAKVHGQPALKRVEAGLTVSELCRELSISTAAFDKWRSKYGGMDVSMIARTKDLEVVNRWLRKMYVEGILKAEIAQEALEKWW